MGVQVEKVDVLSGEIKSVYLEIFCEEVRAEISKLKDRISGLEAKLEDPFG